MQLISSIGNSFRNFPKAFKIFLGLFTILVFTLVGVLIVLKTQNKNKVTTLPAPEKWEKLVLDSKYTPAYILSPKIERKFGIISQEVFSLKTKDPVDQDFIKNNLSSTKPVNVIQKSPTDFEVVPVNSLSPNETISLSMEDSSDYSWTFQTADKLKITGVLPRDQANNVPINAGIEITFNNDNYEIKDTDIQITPTVNFRLEKHDQKIAIVPLVPLLPKTIYQVTVKKDLNYIFSFQTGDTPGAKPRLSLAKDFQEVFPDEPLATKIYASNFDQNQVINAQVYKFSGIEEFISSRVNLDKTKSSWTNYFGEQDPVNTKNLAKVSAADLKVQTKGDSLQVQYLQLPQNLDEGLYLVQFWFDNSTKVEQLWVESSSIPGYVSVGKLQTTVWINSVKNESIGSSTIRILGTGNTYSTNNQGWATFPTPQIFFENNIRHYIVITTASGRELIVPVDNMSGRSGPDKIVADDYWSYLYQERVLYKPNDVINFWGVAKNKDTSSPPDAVDIYIGDNLVQTVKPNSDGSYIGKINLTGAELGYNLLSSKIGNVQLNSSYFQVANYAKPELKIEVTTNRKVIFAGESVNYKARVTFFDGTPATNIKLYINPSYYGVVDKSEAIADKNGEISFVYKSKIDSPNSYPRYEGVTVSAVKSGEALSDGIGNIYVYGSQLQITTETDQNNEQASLTATVKVLDLSLVNDKGQSDPVSDTAKNQKIALAVTRTWWEQKQNGTYYDFVEKVTRPSYNYIRHDEQVDSKDLYTDSQGQVKYNLVMEKSKSYQLKLSTVDSSGRPTERTNYYYYSDYQNNQNQASKSYMTMDRNNNSFSIGENVNIKIQKNGVDYQKTDSSRFLFILAVRGRQEIYASNSPTLTFTFNKSYIPEVYVGSLVFNGRSYEEVTSTCKNGWICGGYDYYNNDYFFDPLVIKYQRSDSKLDLTITSDKNKYQPGNTAVLSVKVTKKGTPVPDTQVQLTLVDEALAAIGGVNEPSIETSLYKQSSNLIYYNYYSHRPVFPDVPQAERGGGGGGRELFKDTAYFDTAKTNGDGIAIFNVKLPDNITNWLTFAQALTTNLDAGQTKSSVVSTKDFFITSQFPSTVLSKDKPVIAVGTFGNLLAPGVKIPISVSVFKDDKEISKSNLEVDSFNESYIDFPSLSAGNYKVTVSGDYKSNNDGVTLPSQIIDSRLDFKMMKNKILENGQTLKSFDDVTPAINKPIKMVVTDEGKGKYYYDLSKYCYQNSNRLEKRVASIKAGQILTSRFKDLDCNSDITDLINFQSGDGGLRQVEWGENDLESTLWATYVDPSPFNKELLINYFENNSQVNSTEAKIMRNWGLTLLGKPQVNELNQLTATASTFREKVFAAIALHSAGNKEKSREIYFSIMNTYAYTNKPYIRIEADEKKRDYDTFAIDTSYVLLLGALNHMEYNQGLNLYLQDYGGYVSNVILDVANIEYIDTILSDLPDNNSLVTFKAGAKLQSQNITKDGPMTVNLSANDVNNFNLKVDGGKVEATLIYFATPTEFSNLKTDNRIRLTKSVTKVLGGSGPVKLGDTLRIDIVYTFNDTAPLGCYNLTDHIPSGLTYLNNPGDFGLFVGQNGYMYPSGNNIVKGCGYNARLWNRKVDRSVYFVRVTGVGKFIQEPAILQSGIDPSIFQKTSEEYLSVEQ